MNAPFDPAHGVYLAGWDRRNRVTSRSIAVHHPRVLEKRISFDDDPTTITVYGSDVSHPNGTHLRVGNWEVGTTEGGSSGSPCSRRSSGSSGSSTGGGSAAATPPPTGTAGSSTR
jgi:lysyl endopeptidase